MGRKREILKPNNDIFLHDPCTNDFIQCSKQNKVNDISIFTDSLKQFLLNETCWVIFKHCISLRKSLLLQIPDSVSQPSRGICTDDINLFPKGASEKVTLEDLIVNFRRNFARCSPSHWVIIYSLTWDGTQNNVFGVVNFRAQHQ